MREWEEQMMASTDEKYIKYTVKDNDTISSLSIRLEISEKSIR